MATELSAQRETYYAELAAASRAGADATRWLDWFCRAFQKASARSAAVIDISLTKARFWNQHASVVLSLGRRDRYQVLHQQLRPRPSRAQYSAANCLAPRRPRT
jgi:Fic family protein